MSEEQLKAFLEKVQSDTELQEKLKAATNADEPIVIAKEAGFEISLDDLKSAQSEISDEELEEASGGTGGWVKASLKAGKTSVICAIPITVAVSVKYC
jgi:predicted ribosomally synthesized peptide with nif11-like leader